MSPVTLEADPFTIEIIKGTLTAIGEEMFAAQKRTSMSPVIYETLDFGVGVTDAQGRLIAQGTGIPGFVGALDGAVRDAIEKFGRREIRDGDIFITNDPYGGGGTHLSDVTLMKPVFFSGQLVAWTANKGHWTELGGANPGSFSVSTTDVYQEGLQLPCLRLFDRGRPQPAILDLIGANVRLPEMTLGDLWSSAAAIKVGARRLLSLFEKYGGQVTLQAIDALQEHGARMTAKAFDNLPKGRFKRQHAIDEDGLGNGPFEVAVEIRITDSHFVADFAGTAEAAPGPINCTRAALISAAREVFMGVVRPAVPATHGCFRQLEVRCPDNTVLTAQRPAPTSSYFEAMVAAADAMRLALAPAMPGRLAAGQFGSVCSMVLSRTDAQQGRPFILVQPLAGGWGAGADKDGESAQFCVGNGETSNIPVEIQEGRYGVRVERYQLRRDGGGEGKFQGGKGVVLEYLIEEEGLELSTYLGRGKTPPPGMLGGGSGTTNYAEVVNSDGSRRRITMAGRVRLKAGDRVRICTGTGGGWGRLGRASSRST